MPTIKEIAIISTKVIQSEQEKEIFYTPKYAVNILNRIINGEELNDKNLSQNPILNDTSLNIDMQLRWLGNKLLMHKANVCDCYMAVVDSFDKMVKEPNVVNAIELFTVKNRKLEEPFYIGRSKKANKFALNTIEPNAKIADCEFEIITKALLDIKNK